MTCDHATELLPWLLNGTLDPEERREVLEHVRECAACRQALEEARLSMSAADAHLPTEALVALAFGEPAPQGIDAALVEEHLAVCPQCAADLELARTSRALADEEVALFPGRRAPAVLPASRGVRSWQAAALAAGLAAVLFAAGWLTTRQALDRMEERVAVRPAPVEDSPSEDHRLAELAAENRRLREAAKAGEAAERTAREEAEALRRELDERQPAGASGGPQVNTVIADLFPPGADVVRGEGGPGGAIELPPTAGGLTLILNGEERSPLREHEVELRDAAGKRVWSAKGLVQQDLTFTLHLPRQAIAPGGYTLDVYGLDGGRREKVASYRFSLK